MKYSGSTAVTISAEMSVNRLVSPRRTTLALTRDVTAGVNRRRQGPAAWSRTVVYTLR